MTASTFDTIGVEREQAEAIRPRSSSRRRISSTWGTLPGYVT